MDIDKIVTYCNIELDTYTQLWSTPGINETFFGKIFTRNLEEWTRKYSLPEDLKHIHTVYVNPKGIEEFEAKLYTWPDISNETNITEQMYAQYPKYRIFGNDIKIFSAEPIIDVTSGIRIEWIMYPTPFEIDDFDKNDRDMSIPRTLASQWLVRDFHKILLYRVTAMWKSSQDKPISLNDTEKMYQWHLADVLGSLWLFVVKKRYRLADPHDDYATSYVESPLN